MFHCSHTLLWVLCLAGLFGCSSGCTNHAIPPPGHGEQAIEVWDEATGEPVLVEDGP